MKKIHPREKPYDQTIEEELQDMVSNGYKTLVVCLAVCFMIFWGCGKKWTETEKDGIRIVENEGGRTLGYSTASGIKLVFEDGYAFKDLNRNGRLGIPANNSSDPRHGTTTDAEFNAGVATYRQRNHS